MGESLCSVRGADWGVSLLSCVLPALRRLPRRLCAVFPPIHLAVAPGGGGGGGAGGGAGGGEVGRGAVGFWGEDTGPLEYGGRE